MTAYEVHRDVARSCGIQATGLTKRYDGETVLNGVDLVVRPGEILALLGPNGAGKTTTVSILATLIRADAGSARVAGFDVSTERSRVRRLISLTGQDIAVDALLTGEENLRTVGRVAGLSRKDSRARARELLARFDLDDAADRRAGSYSGGMLRRLDLAAGLVVPPQVLFLDEPTTGLDPRSRQAVWDIVTELAEGAGVTVLLTTQYLEEADRLADQLALIDHGRIVAEGTPGELKREVADERVELTFSDAEAFEHARRAVAGRAALADADRRVLSVPTDGSAQEVRTLLDQVDPSRRGIARLSVKTATLDEVFLALTGRQPSTQDKEPLDA